MDFSKVGAYLEECVKNGLPMGQVRVTKDYETVYSYNAGWRDAEKTIPASDDTLCWCFSNTKVYTAVCLMRLVEEGKIKLDDPVSKYLPEFAETFYLDGEEVRKAEKPVTVRHLITMTSGLSYAYKTRYPHFAEAVEKPGMTTREAIAALPKDPWKFAPGTDYIYGLGHDVVAAVIEVASGMRFSEYMKKIIIEPLGIKDTDFRPNAEQASRLAAMSRAPRDGERIRLLRKLRKRRRGTVQLPEGVRKAADDARLRRREQGRLPPAQAGDDQAHGDQSAHGTGAALLPHQQIGRPGARQARLRLRTRRARASGSFGERTQELGG